MTQTQAPAPREKRTFSYRLANAISWPLLTVLFPVRYHNVERSRLDAPYMLIANHFSMLDPLIVGWKIKRYQIRYLGKKELTNNPLLRAMFQSLRMIPVSRHNMDMGAIRACVKAIGDKHVLGVFPEGTRYKQGIMKEMESGFALIALRANVPLLPAYITEKPRLFHRVDCYYGSPVLPSTLSGGGTNREACERLMQGVSDLYDRMIDAREHGLPMP